MASVATVIRGWIAGVSCAGAALLSGYAIFVEPPAGSGIWLHVVFLLAILLGTVTVVRLLARRAVASIDRGTGERPD
jgi:hypothetical protein